MAIILLVEDEPDQLELRSMILTAAGHQVRQATNAQQALSQAEGCQVAVLDMRIPRLSDGLKLVETIRARWPDMHLIAVTGWPQDLQTARPHVDAILEKPFRTTALLHEIQTAASLQ